MQFLLKLKHWQLFMLTWGLAILINASTFSNPNLFANIFPITVFIAAVGTFAWIYSIGTVLHDKLPEGVPLNIKRFKILFLIPAIYAFILGSGIGLLFNDDRFEPGQLNIILVIILIVHFTATCFIVYGIRFAAKTFRSVETGMMAHFNNYILYFFLIVFSFIGYWIIQPRLNKIMDKKN